MQSDAYVNGPPVAEFEASSRRTVERVKRVGLASGLDALRLALLATGRRARRRGDRAGDDVRRDVEAVTQVGAVRRSPSTSSETDYGLDARRGRSRDRTATRRPSCPCTSTGSWPTCERLDAIARAARRSDRRGRCQAHGASATVSGRRGRPRRRLQLLPGQEPRRDGRRRRARHDDGELAGTRARAARARPAAEVPPRRGLDRAARHDPGARPLRKLPLLDGWNDERRQRRRALLEALAASATSAAARRRRTASRSGISSSCERPIPTALAEHLAERGIGPGATTRSRRTSAARTPLRLRGRARSRSPRRSRASASRCRSSRASPRRSSSTSSRRSRRGSDVADGPANDAPYRLIDDVEFGEGVVVHSFTNLYGCTIGDGTRIGTVRRDPARRGRSARAARSRATRSSATA